MILNNNLSIVQFLKEYGSEEACENYLSFKRWPDNISCPFCGSDKIYILKGKSWGVYKCGSKACRKKFSPIIKTIFENTKIPLRTWFLIIYLQCLNKKNVSSRQVASNCGITQKSAWGIGHKIRELYWQENITLSGTVEIDEAFLSSCKRFYKWGSLSGRKAPILGLIERGGSVVIQCIPDRTTGTIDKIVNHYVEHGSTIYTDGWIGYQNLSKNYNHHYLDHGAREYVNNIDAKIHTNNIENVWRQLKVNIRGAHHSVSKMHAQLYCDEIAYRINNRNKKPIERFNNLLERAVLRKSIKPTCEILKVA